MATISESILASSATTVASLLALTLIGIFAAHYPRHPSGKLSLSGVVSQSAIAGLSKLSTYIFVPALTFYSLGSRLSTTVMSEAWPLILWAPFNVLAGATFATIATYVACVPQKFRKEFVIACSFNNIAVLPLVLMEILCKQEQLSNEDECFERSTSFIYIAIFGWSLCFWTVGLKSIKSLKDEPEVSQSGLSDYARGLLSPALLSCVIGGMVGLIGPVRRFIFDDGAPLFFISSASNAYGSSVVGVTTFVMATTLGKSMRSLDPRVLWCSNSKSAKANPQSTNKHKDAINHDYVSQGNDSAVTSISTHKENTDNQIDIAEVASTGDPNLAIIDLELSESFEQQEKGIFNEQKYSLDNCTANRHSIVSSTSKLASEHHDKAIGEKELPNLKWSSRTLVAFVLVSMVFMPTFSFGMVLLFGKRIFIGANATLIQFVLSIQSVAPTANFVIVLYQQEGCTGSAERTSRGVVFQYLTATITLLVITTLAISHFYGGN